MSLWSSPLPMKTRSVVHSLRGPKLGHHRMGRWGGPQAVAWGRTVDWGIGKAVHIMTIHFILAFLRFNYAKRIFSPVSEGRGNQVAMQNLM